MVAAEHEGVFVPMVGLNSNRRTLLKVGGLGLLGLTMPNVLRAVEKATKGPKARAKSVIFLFQYGGPSHIDMFDMKPDAPSSIRGPFNPISSSADGIQVCEKLPKTAKIMDKVSVIRSVHHTMKNHNSAGYYALTGHAPPSDDQRLRESLALYPAYGSVVDKLAPSDGAMPAFISYPHVIADGSITPGQGASFLGKRHDPFFFQADPNANDFALPELTLPNNLSLDRLADRRGLQSLIDRQAGILESSAEARGVDALYQKSLSMLSSPKLKAAFDLSREAAPVREAYGRSTYGQGCLLARRLVEHGAKFVTVYFSKSIGGRSTTEGGWDTHGFDNTRMFPIVEKYHFPITEQTLPTFLNDLDDRGLLKETLVVWMGEFGRTPKINDNKSRDHWPQCYSVLLAGGGVKGGYVYGASDKHAMYPDDKPVTLGDLSATMYHLLGIDPATEVHDTQDRPLPIATGEPILDVIG